MSEKDYWHSSDFKVLWAYVDAYKIKMTMQRDYDNQLAWLSGMYVRNAVGAVLGGGDYGEALDFTEMDRWNKLTQDEKNKELKRQAVENSKSQIEQAMATLEANKKDGD